MTQRLQAEAALDRIRIDDTDVQTLRRVVGEAQNNPPYGEADGSLNVDTWTALRDITDALETVKRNLPLFRRIT